MCPILEVFFSVWKIKFLLHLHHHRAVAIMYRNVPNSMQENSTVIVPPNSTDEEFNLNWEEISSSVNAFPVEYTLTAQGEELDTSLLPMVCHI